MADHHQVTIAINHGPMNIITETSATCTMDLFLPDRHSLQFPIEHFDHAKSTTLPTDLNRAFAKHFGPLSIAVVNDPTEIPPNFKPSATKINKIKRFIVDYIQQYFEPGLPAVQELSSQNQGGAAAE